MIEKNLTLKNSTGTFTKFSKNFNISHIPCLLCRKSKRKCSKTYPECSRCIEKGLSCNYDDRPKNGINGNIKDTNNNDSRVIKISINKGKENNEDKIRNYDGYTKFRFKTQQVAMSNKVQINNWKVVAFLKKILHKSKIDKNERVFITSDGSIEYYGSNIFGNIITTFQTLKKENKHIAPKISLVSSKTNLVQPFREIKLARDHLTRESIEAFFEHYNSYLNFMDEDVFLKTSNPLLESVVVIIGLRYLNPGHCDHDFIKWLGQRIQHLLKEEFYKPSLNLVITLVLVSQYIGIPELFKGAYMYTGVANRMALGLGLHQLPKNYKRMSKKYLRVRYSTWQMCRFNEKMHALLLNRPAIVTDDLPIYSFQKPPRLPPLNYQPTQTELKLARNVISLAYFNSLMNLGTIIGLYIVCVKVHFPANLKEAPLLCHKMLTKLSNWYKDLFDRMKKIWLNQPEWVHTLCHHFICYSALLYHSIRLHLLNYFLRSSDILERYGFIKEILHSSTSIVLTAESLKEAYFQNGTTNRFFNLCCAILSLNYLSMNKNPLVSQRAQPLLIKAIQVLYNARFKFPVVEDFFRMIPDVVHLRNS